MDLASLGTSLAARRPSKAELLTLHKTRTSHFALTAVGRPLTQVPDRDISGVI